MVGRMKASCPWAGIEKHKPVAVTSGAREGESVIEAFNAAHDLAAILEGHGYKRKGKRYKKRRR